MNRWIFISLLSIVETLRRLWRRIKGPTPVPVRVPVRHRVGREQDASHSSLLRVLLKTDGFTLSRRPGRW